MLKVSPDRLVKPGIEHATPGLQGKRVIYYTMGALSCHARIQESSLGGGGQVHLTRKAQATLFFCIYLVLYLFYRSKMVISFSKVPEGVQHFSRRGFQLFPGGRGPIVYSI